MSTETAKIANLLKLVSDIVKDADIKVIDAAYISLRKLREHSKKKSSSKSDALLAKSTDKFDLSPLDNFQTRKEVELFLEEVAKNKSDLEKIARQLKLPLSKREDHQELIDKIVDLSVGYKLRSKAIRGKEAELNEHSGDADG